MIRPVVQLGQSGRTLDPRSRARPVAGYPELLRYVGTAISEVLQGAAQPKEALDRAAQQAEQALLAGG